MLSTEKIKGLFKGDNRTKIIVSIGLIGILLIFLSNLSPKTKDIETPENILPSVSMSDLELKTQLKLKSMVEKISGAGLCEVVVTFDSTAENIYASEIKTSNDTLNEENKEEENSTYENEIVIIDSKNGKEALLLKEIQPKVRGVVVICDGGDNILVKQKVIDAVTTSLDISSAKVFVTN